MNSYRNPGTLLYEWGIYHEIEDLMMRIPIPTHHDAFGRTVLTESFFILLRFHISELIRAAAWI